MLLGRSPQAQRPATGRLRRGLEDRVVAEPAAPARLRGDPSATRAACGDEPDTAARAREIGECQRQHAHVPSAPFLRRQPAQRIQQLVVVRGVRRMLARVTTSAQTGVVRQYATVLVAGAAVLGVYFLSKATL